MLIFTDRSLNRYQISEPFDGDIEQSGLNVTDSLQNTRIRIGVIDLTDRTAEMKKEFGIPQDQSVWIYVSNSYAEYDYEEIIVDPYNDRSFRFETTDLIFVYWYLANVGKRISYIYGKNLNLSSETPTVQIDISDKAPGMRPMKTDRRENILYTFTDEHGTAHLHDTKILDTMTAHETSESKKWRILPKNTTLNGIIDMCGNCISDVIVYDHANISESKNVIPDCHPPPIPIEYITNSEKYWGFVGNWKRGVRSRPGNSIYGDCQALSYMISSKDSMDRCIFEGDENGISLAVVISRDHD